MLCVCLKLLFKPILGLVLLFSMATFSAQAQQSLSTEQLIEMLQNSAPSREEKGGRSLSAEELMQMQRNSLSIENKSTNRALKRQPSANASQNRVIKKKMSLPRPSVDLEILFEYNSDKLSPQAYPILVKLGQALTDDRLRGSVFMIAGHTDAKGGAAYNQDLSMRRALAVKDFLSQSFSIPPQTLVAIGYGEQQLKNPFDPNSGENRRVQIVNLQ